MEKLLEKEKGIDSKRASEKGPLLDLLIHDLTGPLSVVSKSAASLSQEESRFGPGSPICGEEVRDLYL
jgi:hypothetical protein